MAKSAVIGLPLTADVGNKTPITISEFKLRGFPQCFIYSDTNGNNGISFFFLYQFLVISAHMHTSNVCTTLLHHQKPELLTSPLNAYHCGCQCEWPFNQCSCLCCTLGVLTFLLIITFMFCNVLPHSCSIDSLSY